jgi:phospholipid N-methyltransferase
MFLKRSFSVSGFVVAGFVVLLNTTTLFGAKVIVGPHICKNTSLKALMKDYVSDSLIMTKEFFKDPKNIGAITPCSPFVVREILKVVPMGNILEIGGGCGTIGYPIAWGLNTLFPNLNSFRIDIVEPNKTFFAKMTSKVKNLRNVYLYNTFFDLNWAPANKKNISYDLIIATIPWTQLESSLRKGLLQKIYDLLAPDGTFVYISLIFANTKEELLNCFKGKQGLAKKDLENYFDCKEKFKLFNLPSVYLRFGSKRPIPLDQK